MNNFTADLRYGLQLAICKKFGEKLSQWIPEETIISILLTKLGLLLLLQAMLTTYVPLLWYLSLDCLSKLRVT